MRIQYKENLPYFIFLLWALVYFNYLLGFPLYHDAYALLNSSQIAMSHTFDYWINIFTNVNHGSQYRPISFFAYFWIIGKTFQGQIWPFHLISTSCLLFATIYLYKFLQNILNHKILSTLLCLIFLLNPYQVHLTEITFGLKYYFTLFIFTFGLHLISKPSFNKSQVVKLLLLYSIGILCHEGIVTFFFVWVVMRYILNKKIERILYILVSPVIFYLIARIFMFSIPSTGGMAVNLSTPLNEFPTFFKYAFVLNTVNFVQFYICLTFIISISLFYWFKKKDISLVLWLTCGLLIVFPFMLLKNHIVPNRVIWASVFVPIFIALLLRPLSIILQKRSIFMIVLFLVLTIKSFFVDLRNTKEDILKLKHNATNFLKTPRDIYQNDSKTKYLFNFKPRIDHISNDMINVRFFNISVILLNMFAQEFPSAEALYNIYGANEKVHRYYLYKGACYFIENENKIIDMFGISHEFLIAFDQFKTVEIPDFEWQGN